jgi:hypothetical protein
VLGEQLDVPAGDWPVGDRAWRAMGEQLDVPVGDWPEGEQRLKVARSKRLHL